MNYKFIDFGDVFLKEKYARFYLKNDVHFSVEGHARIADELIRYIENLEH
jgi:hypothetical protein